MKVGVFTPLLSQLPLEEVLEKLKSHNVQTVELGTGNYPGDAHCKLSMLDDRAALDSFQKKLADHGFAISALSCHSNPLHPNQDLAQKQREISRKTILLAEQLGVKTVIDFSGCPGDSQTASSRIGRPPVATRVSRRAEVAVGEGGAPLLERSTRNSPTDHGVRVAIEMHPGFLVYNPESMLRLRSEAGHGRGLQLRPEPHVLAGNRSLRRHPRARRSRLSLPRQRHANV